MLPPPRVFVTRQIPERGLRLLEDVCTVEVWADELPPPPDVLLAHARDCDALLTLLTDRVDVALLDACPHLRVVANLAVGYDNIDVAAATARGIMVGNTPDILTETTADAAFALLLAAARRLPEAIAYVKDDRWQTWGPLLLLGQDVHHATLGIVGLGRIGQAVARRARGFAMRVIYADVGQSSPSSNSDGGQTFLSGNTIGHRQPEVEAELGVEYVAFADLLAQSDFISLHAPLTSATRGIFGAEAFAQMRPHAILINTARGGLVQTDALVAALQAGTIGGAALDVTDPEPLRADHPLVHLPNCIVVPHIASASAHTRGQMSEIAARNILAALRGEAMPAAAVNPAAAGIGRQQDPRRYALPR